MNAPVVAYMRQALEGWGVTIQDQTLVTALEPDVVHTGSGPVAYDLCLWTGGFVAPSLAREAGLAVNERGQILVDPTLRAVAPPEIMAVGDAAQPVEDPGVPVRMSAYTALILGAHGADSLNAQLRGREPQPLSFAYVGQGIALGRHKAIGFGKNPNDTPHPPYFTGRAGYEIRAVLVRFLGALPQLERRWPGFFFWAGKDRYAAAQRAGGQRTPVDSAL